MKIHITNIEWDITDEEYDNENVNLPTEVDLTDEDTGFDIDDLNDVIADYLSDTYGFCVNSFTIE